MKPEKSVQVLIQHWAYHNGWSLEIYDSKAISRGKGKDPQKNPGLPVGTPDMMGHSDTALAVYVELKRLGKSGVCRMSQRIFLERKIDSGAFAVVVDSPKNLEETYHKWISLRSESQEASRKFLLSQLPNRVLCKGRIMTIGPS